MLSLAVALGLAGACCANAARFQPLAVASTHQREAKKELRFLQRAGGFREEGFQMPDRMEQWVGIRTGGRLLLPAQQRTQRIHPLPKPLPQVIERLQGERQSQ